MNLNGSPFRNARITEEYLKARLEELKWAVTTRALKEREREEQRQLREQMREEEKARREYERATQDAAKEESTLRKAMEKAQQVAAASEAQRAEFEARLAALQEQLKAAEEKSACALHGADSGRPRLRHIQHRFLLVRGVQDRHDAPARAARPNPRAGRCERAL